MLGADIYKTVENNKPGAEEEQIIVEAPEEKMHPPGILKKPTENGELDPRKQNEINEKIQNKGHNFPIPLALTILVIWILLSSALFCLWFVYWVSERDVTLNI